MNSKTASTRSDMWSVGVVTYMLLSGGKGPFYSGSRYKIFIFNVSHDIHFNSGLTILLLRIASSTTPDILGIVANPSFLFINDKENIYDESDQNLQIHYLSFLSSTSSTKAMPKLSNSSKFTNPT